MGKRDRSDSSSSGSSSDGSSSGDERKRHKKEKKSKSKKEKKSKDKKDKKDKKHKKDKDKKTDLVKAAKEFLKSQLAAGGGTGRTAGLADGSGPGPSAGRDLPPVQVQIDEKNRITQDDYFQKNAEFTVWLQEERHVMFNEMTTEQSHEMFQVFTELWNAGRLAPKFYSNTITAPVKRTTHVWAFSGAGGDEVKKGMAAYLEDQREQRGMQRVADRQEQKEWRKDEKERLDELLPKATGRDAIVEKRIARREEAKARDASPDRVVLPGGGDVFGGDDSIAAARAWEAKRAEGFRNRALLKAEDVQARAAAAQAKEDERMAGFRALVSKGPITIAKRQ